MKIPVFSLLAGLAAAPLLAADGTANLTDQKERISYALGVNFGSNLKSQGVEANLDTVRKGIEDALAGKPQLSDAEMRETFNQLRTQIQARREEKAKENKATSEKWLAENATKAGIQKTASGLQYKVVQEGSGEVPGATDEVSVKYTGKLIDGTVFDSTDKRGGTPARFRVGGVIKGWGEALQMMKKGSKWQLFIPPDLGYREAGTGSIPGNAVLIFDVELVDVHRGATPPTLPQPVTSDIIKVPSKEEMEKGAKIEIIKPEDVDKEIAKEKARKEAEAKKQ